MPPRRPLVHGAVAIRGVAIDVRRYTASLDGVPLSLTPTEFVILFTLTVHPGWVFSRDELAAILYPNEHQSSLRAIDSHIKHLRAKCRVIRPGAPVIRTVYGRGYACDG